MIQDNIYRPGTSGPTDRSAIITPLLRLAWRLSRRVFHRSPLRNRNRTGKVRRGVISLASWRHCLSRCGAQEVSDESLCTLPRF